MGLSKYFSAKFFWFYKRHSTNVYYFIAGFICASLILTYLFNLNRNYLDSLQWHYAIDNQYRETPADQDSDIAYAERLEQSLPPLKQISNIHVKNQKNFYQKPDQLLRPTRMQMTQ